MSAVLRLPEDWVWDNGSPTTAMLGFRNLEPGGTAELEIVDRIPVAVRDGELINLR